MRKKGFTFVELLVALSLYSIGMISILQIFPVNRRLLTQSGNQTQAAFLAQEEMEYVRSLPYSSITQGTFEAKETIPNSSGTSFAQFQRSTNVDYVDSSYNTSTTDTSFKRITVVVYWNEGNIPRTYTLTTFTYSGSGGATASPIATSGTGG